MASKWSAYPLTGPLGDGVRRREKFVSMGYMQWRYQGMVDELSLLVEIVITGSSKPVRSKRDREKISRPFRNDHLRRYLPQTALY